MNQHDLFGDGSRRQSIQARFERFHQDHPDVYRQFKEMAFRLLDRGRDHYGAKAIMEVIRFHHATSSQGAEDFKLNNIYTSRYVRMLIAQHPEFEGFFETRTLTAE